MQYFVKYFSISHDVLHAISEIQNFFSLNIKRLRLRETFLTRFSRISHAIYMHEPLFMYTHPSGMQSKELTPHRVPGIF